MRPGYGQRVYLDRMHRVVFPMPCRQPAEAFGQRVTVIHSSTSAGSFRVKGRERETMPETSRKLKQMWQLAVAAQAPAPLNDVCAVCNTPSDERGLWTCPICLQTGHLGCVERLANEFSERCRSVSNVSIDARVLELETVWRPHINGNISCAWCQFLFSHCMNSA